MFGWTRRQFFYVLPPLLPAGIRIEGGRRPFRQSVAVFCFCLLTAYGLSLGARMLELPYWGNPVYMAGDEYLLATHDAYHWIAGAEGFEFGTGHPMSEMAVLLSKLTGLEPANAGFWAPPFLSALLAVSLFLWGWALGYPYAGVCAGVLSTLSPSFFARTLLGFYDTDLVILLFAVLLGLVPAFWLTPWLSSIPDVLASIFKREPKSARQPFADHLPSTPGRNDTIPTYKRPEGFFAPVPKWYFGKVDQPGLLALSPLEMRASLIQWPWLLALAFSGLFGHWTQQWHSSLPYLVRFSGLLIPVLILLLGPRGGRAIMLRAALCHVLPLLAGFPGMAAALVYGSGLLLFRQKRLAGTGQLTGHVLSRPIDPGGLLGRVGWSLPLALALWAAVLVHIADGTVISAMAGSFQAYVNRTGDLASLATAVDDPIVFPSVAQSIIEVQTVSFGELLSYFYPYEVVALAAFVCFFLLLLFIPALGWFVPLIILSLLSLKMGGRMSMFGPPGLMLGLCMAAGLLCEWFFFRASPALLRLNRPAASRVFSALFRSPLIGRFRPFDEGLRMLWCLSCCCIFGWPLLAYLPEYTQGPAISREQADALRFVRNNSPEEAVIWNWWDWGYASHHFARRTAIADGARHGGPSLYLPAAVYTTTDPFFARQLIKYTATRDNQPGKVFEGLSAREAQALMEDLADKSKPLIEAPGKQYIVVSLELVRLGLWVTRHGSWDFNLKQGPGALMSNLTPAIEYNLTSGQVKARNGTPVMADSIDVLKPGGVEHVSFRNGTGYHFLFSPQSPELRAETEKFKHTLAARFWRLARGDFRFTALINDKIAMNSAYYWSMMVQLLVCPPDDPRITPYFTLVYDNVFTRVYEVK